MTTLREAAQQALEALDEADTYHRNQPDQRSRRLAAMAALRTALAQQDEPVKHQHKWFRTGAMEPGQMRCIDCGEWGKEQAEPLNLADPAVQKRLAAQWGYVPAAAQAEPVQEPVAWVASKDGRVIYDDASTDDGLLRVSGDFENDEQRVRYAQRIVDKLNAAPPQRTMVPLTEEEIFKIENDIPDDVISDRAWTICLTRAVELAHGIKE